MFSKYETVFFVPTAKELSKIFGAEKTSRHNGFEYSFFNGKPVIITGIGKTNAAVSAAFFFKDYRPEKAVLTGICGAYRASGLKIGTVVSVTKDYFADEGSFDGGSLTSLEEKGIPVWEGGPVPFGRFEGFAAAVSNTVSLIPTENRLSELYRMKTGAEVENMEGAAFGLAAIKAGINAFQIRAVSNYCGAEPEWNIKKAAENLLSAVASVV